MDTQALDATLKLHFTQTRLHLERAAAIAKAAEACADAGNCEKAIEICLDVEQLIFEVTTFLNAASLMNRIYKT